MYWEVSQRLANGVHLIYGESLADEAVPGVEGIPSHKNVVRGTMGPSGWVVAPHNDGRQSCVTYISVTDLKVSRCPHRLVWAGVMKAAYVVWHILDITQALQWAIGGPF